MRNTIHTFLLTKSIKDFLGGETYYEFWLEYDINKLKKATSVAQKYIAKIQSMSMDNLSPERVKAYQELLSHLTDWLELLEWFRTEFVKLRKNL